MEDLTLDELKVLEKAVKQRIASLKPKRQIDLNKIKSRIDLYLHHYGPQWEQELVYSLNNQIREDFEKFFDMLVGIQTATNNNWTNIGCANRFTDAYQLYIDEIIAEKRKEIEESLPKPKISVVFNEVTDRYQC